MPRTSRGAQAESSGTSFVDFLRKGKDNYATAAHYEKDLKPFRVPPGEYVARLLNVKWGQNKDKEAGISLFREHVIIEGEFKGQIISDMMYWGHGEQEYPVGKIRHYISKATGNACPDDPGELDQIVKDLNSKYAYDCKIEVAYSGEGTTGYCNPIVLECWDVDPNITAEAPAATGIGTSAAATAPAAKVDEEMEDMLAFCVKQKYSDEEWKEQKLDKSKKADVKAMIGKYDYEVGKTISEEDADFLKTLGLEDRVIRPQPAAPARKARGK